MNVIAPLFVLAVRSWLPRASSPHLLAAAVIQLVLIWFWHAPPILTNTHGLHLVMQVSLFASALFFWWSVLMPSERAWWLSAIALLITSKLFCLLGVLLTFSPRPLFAGMHGSPASLADQQFAGLMMLVACPASYLLAAVWISARGLIGTEPEARGQRHA